MADTASHAISAVNVAFCGYARFRIMCDSLSFYDSYMGKRYGTTMASYRRRVHFA